MSRYTVEPTERAWSDQQMEGLFGEGLQSFITADLEVNKYIGRVRKYFSHLDRVLVSEEGQPAATGWGVPITWTDDVADLPRSMSCRCRPECCRRTRTPRWSAVRRYLPPAPRAPDRSARRRTHTRSSRSRRPPLAGQGRCPKVRP